MLISSKKSTSISISIPYWSHNRPGTGIAGQIKSFSVFGQSYIADKLAQIRHQRARSRLPSSPGAAQTGRLTAGDTFTNIRTVTGVNISLPDGLPDVVPVIATLDLALGEEADDCRKLRKKGSSAKFVGSIN